MSRRQILPCVKVYVLKYRILKLINDEIYFKVVAEIYNIRRKRKKGNNFYKI